MYRAKQSNGMSNNKKRGGEIMQTISLKLELLKPTKAKERMYQQMTEINTRFSNWLLTQEDLSKASSKTFKAFSEERFPSAVSSQTVRIVKSQKKHQKAKGFKRFWCEFNNQNCRIEKKGDLYKVSFPTLEKRVGVPVVTKAYQQQWLEKLLNGKGKQGTAVLHHSRGRWYISIPITFKVQKNKALNESTVMGIDLGLNNLAVATIGTSSLFFKGNEVAYQRRRFASRRRQLGKAKKLQAIRKSKNKESRWMKNINHRISRQIVDTALMNGVHLIRMEDLTGIRLAKSTKEAGRNLHSWSFYELQTFIAYKAGLAGIQVEYVNPEYTSQTCKCGYKHKNNRKQHRFHCRKCGYKGHADVNAAINIRKAISGPSKKKLNKVA